MTEVLGVNTILDRALPTGVDGTRLAQWQLRDGTTYQEMIGSLAQALAGKNQELNQMYGYAFFLTEEFAMEYEDGQSVTPMPKISDVSKVDAVHGKTIGHMIDLEPYGSSIGGSRRFFRDARLAQLRSSISTIVRRGVWRFEVDLFTRMMVNTEYAVGSGGYNVPFVRGTGGNVDYVPPAFGGQSFTSAHDHFLGVDSDTKGFDDLLNDLAGTVEEHGHPAPFVAWVSRADVASYRALTKFVEFTAPIVQVIDRGSETTGNQMFTRGNPMVTEGVFGYFQSDYGLIELRAYSRIPTGYASLFKSYGMNDMRNPLAIRVHPTDGFGMYIVTETTDDNQYPIKKVTVEMEHGIGVGMDRTNGAVAFLDSSGTWTNPTIS